MWFVRLNIEYIEYLLLLNLTYMYTSLCVFGVYPFCAIESNLIILIQCYKYDALGKFE